MKAKQKRNNRTYKTTDLTYKKARARAKKDKEKLSNIVEEMVEVYARGHVEYKFKDANGLVYEAQR